MFNGKPMITNDTVIEINGVPLGAIDYRRTFEKTAASHIPVGKSKK